MFWSCSAAQTLKPTVSSISTFRELEAADSSASGPKMLISTLALVALNSSDAPKNVQGILQGQFAVRR